MNLPMSVYIHETPTGLIVSFDFPEGQVLGLYADDGVLIEQITSKKALRLIEQSRPPRRLLRAQSVYAPGIHRIYIRHEP